MAFAVQVVALACLEGRGLAGPYDVDAVHVFPATHDRTVGLVINTDSFDAWEQVIAGPSELKLNARANPELARVGDLPACTLVHVGRFPPH